MVILMGRHPLLLISPTPNLSSPVGNKIKKLTQNKNNETKQKVYLLLPVEICKPVGNQGLAFRLTLSLTKPRSCCYATYLVSTARSEESRRKKIYIRLYQSLPSQRRTQHDKTPALNLASAFITVAMLHDVLSSQGLSLLLS